MVSSESGSINPLKLLSKTISNHAVSNKNVKNLNYFLSADWSPDGSCILASEPDNSLSIHHFDPSWMSPSEITSPGTSEPALIIREPETVYDISFYPHFTGQGEEEFQ